MIKAYMQRRHEEEGFTLIELMVVVLIIGILIAIALPTFLGARNRANDKAAQSGDRNAIVAAKTCFTDDDTYVGCNDTALDNIETALDFMPTATISDDPNEVSVNAFSATVWYGASFSKSGTCFFIKDDAGTTAAPLGGTTYYKIASAAGAGCTGANARTQDTPGNFVKNGWA